MYLEYRKKLLEKLESFCFESDEEARMFGLTNYKIREKEIIYPLETPFSMKSKDAKILEKNISSNHDVGDTESELEDSSTISSDDNIYHGDIICNITLSVKGRTIVEDSEVLIERGMKYGLVGRNGIGKTTLLKAIKKRKFKIPRGIKIYMIAQECNFTGTVIDHVGEEGGKILSGFGFTREMFGMQLADLSGGWRMRANLAKAINLNPDLLLLDEPTNYLDIKALAWLEMQIKELKTVIIVSHDRNFLNNTVDTILHLNDLKIEVYKGNYDSFINQRNEKIAFDTREYENQLAQRQHLQSFIDRFRYNANRASQAQSKIKILKKMPSLIPPKKAPIIRFEFASTPVFENLIELRGVSFSYKKILKGDSSSNKIDENKIFENISLTIENKSRIVLVGENGQGKSTFLKILNNDLEAEGGYVYRSSSLITGYFAQHHVENLNVNEKALDSLMKFYTQEKTRQALAAFGLNIENQKISTLSGGQKSRLVMATINMKRPNLLIMDEPTNHLDMESIDALSESIKRFEGAVVCISHDLSFIGDIFTEVYVCGDKTIKRFNGTVSDYKESLLRNF